MSERLTRSAARNTFYGGSVFFLAVYVALTVHSHWYVETVSTDKEALTDSVIHGKEIWERHSCINCHTLLGEGAYFAPELGNVFIRYGGKDNPDAARARFKAWMRAMPLPVPDRRQMPQFNLTEEELDALFDFLHWTSTIDTQGWPPTIDG